MKSSVSRCMSTESLNGLEVNPHDANDQRGKHFLELHLEVDKQESEWYCKNLVEYSKQELATNRNAEKIRSMKASSIIEDDE